MEEPMGESTPPRASAVLIPVYRDDRGDLRVVLVVRGAEGIHGGQVALPGGKPEPTDRGLRDTALRETQEEIGLRSRDIDVIAELDPVDTRTTGWRVHPFLARVPAGARWRPRPGEIAAVVTPLARTLADPTRRRTEMLSFPTWSRLRPAECVDVDGHLLWGLTLRLLDTVLPRLLAGEWAI
jgi:8-oxo-dGTP pyrophosphatase MutT (NUDIX family)